ncbi:MAG: MBL fold metallo-hydrolase [Acidimicrobiia bacterium]
MEPVAPTHHHPPHQVAPDTWVVQQLQGEGGPFAVYVNSLVVKGREPVIVDTGTRANRLGWLADAFSLVDPDDVRWVFVSHDDADHVGNLVPVLEECSQATLVASWQLVQRLTCEIDFPLERVRWVNDGESFDAGDRTFTAVTPPLFDSPTTRGLFDHRTRVYWAADCFATTVPSPALDVADLDPAEWDDGFMLVNRLLSPWHVLVDDAKFHRLVDGVESLGISTVASAHSPAIHGEHVAKAFRKLRRLPYVGPAPLPVQAEPDLPRLLSA